MSPLSDIQTTSGNKYLKCDGSLYNRTVYASLFAKIGTNFGAGDGLTDFAVPNYQAAFLRGYGQAMINGQIYEGNFTTNVPQQDAIQEHRHTGQSGSYCGSNRVSQPSGGFFNGTSYPQVYTFDQTGTQSSGRSDPGETRPMNYSVYYYIKT
jgi:microcystin-dependent protein